MKIWRMVCAAALTATVQAPVLAAETGAAARIGAYDDAIVAIMKANLPLKARVQRFETLVAQYYDMSAIAALVIGPSWNATPAAARSAMVKALTRHSAIALAQNFPRYGGEKFVVDPGAQARGSSSIVRMTIQSPGGGNVLQFRMQQASGGWRIVDIVADGVSQIAVQRADLATTVASGGVAAVVKRLDQVDAKAVR